MIILKGQSTSSAVVPSSSKFTIFITPEGVLKIKHSSGAVSDVTGTPGSSVIVDNIISSGSSNPVTSASIFTALGGKVDKSSVTIFAQTLLDDSSAADARATLGLSNVENTLDANKPISTATQAALNNKVNVVAGKQLSTNDYTDTEKNKLSGIAPNATANDTDSNLRNRTNHTGLQSATTIIEDSTHRFVTDTEKATWNSGGGIPSGTSTQYIRGDKTLATFQTDARAAFTAGSGITIVGGVITATGSSGGGVTVDTTIEDGSANPVTGNAIFDALALKLNSSVVSSYILTLLDDANAAAARTTLGLGTASVLDAPASGNATSTQLVKGDDTRITTAVPNTRTINGKALTSNVTITKADVGLTNADDTSDANKPISTATQSALNGKQNTLTPGTGINITSNVISIDAATAEVYVEDDTFSGNGTSVSPLDIKPSFVRGLFSAAGTGLTYNSTTGVFTGSGGGGSPVDEYSTDIRKARALGSPLVAQTADHQQLFMTTSQNLLVANVLYLSALEIRVLEQLTGIAFYTRTTGDFTASDENRVGLYRYDSGTGLTLVASSANDVTGSIWKGTANVFKQVAFSTPYTPTVKGMYFVGFLYNSSAQVTQPGLYQITPPGSPSAILAGGAVHPYTSLTAQATLPSTISIGSLSTTENKRTYGALYK